MSSQHLAVLLYEQEIRWHRLDASGDYEVVAADAHGIWRSSEFPGLWLDGAALLGANMIRLLAVLQQGLASSEHVAFAERLQRKMQAP